MSKSQFLDAWQTREGDLAGKILAVLPQGSDIQTDTAFFTRSPQRQTASAVKQVKMWRRY